MDSLTMVCYFGNSTKQNSLYEDAGDGYAYERESTICLWTTVSDGNRFELMLDTKRGHYEPEYADFPSLIKRSSFYYGKIWLNHNEEDFNLLQKVEQG
ncbi:MAG: DUF5110 domain-containing protein [Saprospiraceae bacterium]|nr:DUF5110 domain-containing protein [Saprospiraceae bacterium]